MKTITVREMVDSFIEGEKLIENSGSFRVSDDGDFLRTAVVVPNGNTVSLDIVTEDGQHVARLNISVDFSTKEWANVDVIKVNRSHLTTVSAWIHGENVLRYGSLFAPLMSVELKKP